MRNLTTIPLPGHAPLAASVDDGGGNVGILIVTGGSQTRIGAHRMAERLAARLAQQGFVCLRFDRRGVGDSPGADPGFRGSGADIAAAAAALRRHRPGLNRIVGFGLCDGATALALHAAAAGVESLILANPWLVETETGAPPPAAIRRHYARLVFSRDAWSRLLHGAIDIRKAVHGLTRIARPSGPSGLAGEVANALAAHPLPVRLILATGDATAIAAEAELKASAFRGRISDIHRIETDAHTFAHPGDAEALADAVTALAQA